MSQSKRQKRRSCSPHSSGTEDSPPPSPRGVFSDPPGPHPDCAAYCCTMGMDWIINQSVVEDYINGPTAELLESMGRWNRLRSEVRLLGEDLQKRGLPPWQSLDPEVQSRLSSWSPVAEQLWGSDFLAHREAMVQAWIWHYLDDYLFSFAGNQQDGTLELRSPVWEHVRALRRDLDVLRARQSNSNDVVYRHQFQTWSRMTEHLVRGGLADNKVFDPEELVAHFKRSLSRLADRRDKIPDVASDGSLCGPGDTPGDIPSAVDRFDVAIRGLLESACQAQYFIHGMDGGYTLRFTPVGEDSDKLFGFRFNPGWMDLNDPIEIPSKRPDERGYPPVQLVSQPMLAASGLKGAKNNTRYTLRTPMCVVTPWTFGGEEAQPYIFAGFEKGWELIPADLWDEHRNRAEERKRREKERQEPQQKPLVEGSRDAEPQTTDGHAIDGSGDDVPCE